jgi:hypothetical protein
VLRIWKFSIFLFVAVASALGAEKRSAQQLIDLAKANSPSLREAITTTFDVKDLKEGTAWVGHGPDFFFAIETTAKPSLVIDEKPAVPMQQVAGSDLGIRPLTSSQ